MNYPVHGVGLSHSLSHSFLQEDGILLSYKKEYIHFVLKKVFISVKFFLSFM